MNQNQRAIYDLFETADEAAACLDSVAQRLRTDRVLDSLQVSDLATMIKMAEHVEAAGKALAKRLTDGVARGVYVVEPRDFLNNRIERAS